MPKRDRFCLRIRKTGEIDKAGKRCDKCTDSSATYSVKCDVVPGWSAPLILKITLLTSEKIQSPIGNATNIGCNGCPLKLAGDDMVFLSFGFSAD